MKSCIDYYKQLQTEFPQDKFGWEGDIKGSMTYQSGNLLNIKIDHYTYTGGAHGYHGLRSLLFNPETRKSIPIIQLFKDRLVFKALAEKNSDKKIKCRPIKRSIQAA